MCFHCFTVFFFLFFRIEKNVCKVKMILNKSRKLFTLLRVVFLLTATSRSMTFSHLSVPVGPQEHLGLPPAYLNDASALIGPCHSLVILAGGVTLRKYSVSEFSGFVQSRFFCTHFVTLIQMCGGCITHSFVILFCCFPLCFSRPQFRLRLC